MGKVGQLFDISTQYVSDFWDYDWVACITYAVAFGALGYAYFMRRGGVPPRTSVVVLGGFATLGALLRCSAWIFLKAADPSYAEPPPSGTDLFLVLGFVGIGGMVLLQEIVQALQGPIEQTSRVELWSGWLRLRWAWLDKIVRKVEELVAIPLKDRTGEDGDRTDG